MRLREKMTNDEVKLFDAEEEAAAAAEEEEFVKNEVTFQLSHQ